MVLVIISSISIHVRLVSRCLCFLGAEERGGAVRAHHVPRPETSE